jgi:hypothetical protein
METIKDKAKELVDKFTNVKSLQDFGGMYNPIAKECAKIAFQEIIKEIDENYDTLHSADRKVFYNDVLKEIDNL